MRYMILSDIHGALPPLEAALSLFQSERCDLLLLLGDILNYGPRNGLPSGLDPQAVAQRLNSMADKIVAVRGNCDSEVDQMLLQFPIMSDYALVVDGQRRLFLTHGHIYNKENRPPLKCDFFFTGHTHLWEIDEKEGIVFCNSGSVTFPKNGNEPTVVIYDDGQLRILNLKGDVIGRYTAG